MPAKKPTPTSKQNKAEKPMNIILLGDPGAGKATQSALLVKKYGLYDFDMGRELSANGFAKFQAKGNLTPTKIVRGILRQTIASIKPEQGILFDGHPKMLGEAKLVRSLLKKARRSDPVFLYLSIPFEEMLKRVHARKGYFDGKFGKRQDDSDTGLKNRARYYRINIAQVIDFFQKYYKYKKISGMGSIQEVHKRILKALGEMSK